MTDTQRLREIQERHGSSIIGCDPKFCTICFLLKQIAALRAMPTPAGGDALKSPAAEDRLEEMVDAYCRGLGTDDPSFPSLRNTMREGMRSVLALFYAEDADAARNAAFYRGLTAGRHRARNKHDKEFDGLMALATAWRERARSAEGQLRRIEALSATPGPASPQEPSEGVKSAICLLDMLRSGQVWPHSAEALFETLLEKLGAKWSAESR